MMKARQYNRRILSEGIEPNIYKMTDDIHIDLDDVNSFFGNDKETKKDVLSMIKSLEKCEELGSLLSINKYNYEKMYYSIYQKQKEPTLFTEQIATKLLSLIKVAEVLSNKYEIVISNPPYMASKYMPKQLKQFIAEKYGNFKSDLFAAFLTRFHYLCNESGHIGVLLPYVWMFIQSYEELRNFVYKNMNFTSIVQLEFNAFEAATVPVALFTFRNTVNNCPFECIRLSDFKGIDVQEPKTLFAVNNKDCEYRYTANQSNFSKIPGEPVAYWASENTFKAFENTKLGEIAKPRQGMATSDNNRFLRAWYEVNESQVFYYAHNSEEALASGAKWFPYNKGGGYRKWYGNNLFLVNWYNDGYEIKQYAEELYGSVTRTIKNIQFYFKDSITWTFIAITPGFRYCDRGFIFDVAGSSIFIEENLKLYTLAFLCSSVAKHLLAILNPTMNIQANDIKALPLILSKEKKEEIEDLAKKNIEISKMDWDFDETSWDFKRHPLLGGHDTIAENFDAVNNDCDERYSSLKNNEEQINKFFINIYGLENDITSVVHDEEITIKKGDKKREVRSLISYAVGCMFGRYSLDVDGLAYAGGEWNDSKYKSYIPDKDNIIPICDDEYFNDDITGRLIEFIKAAYGEDTLEENLRFIADALGGKGTSREVIRDYFINDFYNDHLKIYQKRPIYWQFDSGKKNGFKALVYIHRYTPDLIARMRTSYVHEQQSRYENQISMIQNQIDSAASTSERVKVEKELKKLKEQADELRVYEEKIHHWADKMEPMDLDDGVKANYAKFQELLTKIK